MELDARMNNLIAIGAAVAANCQPCLEFALNKAAEDGAAPWEMAAALNRGRMVRAGAAGQLDALAEKLLAEYEGIARPAGSIDACPCRCEG